MLTENFLILYQICVLVNKTLKIKPEFIKDNHC